MVRDYVTVSINQQILSNIYYTKYFHCSNKLTAHKFTRDKALSEILELLDLLIVY